MKYPQQLVELAHEAMQLAQDSKFKRIAVPKSLAHPGFTGNEYDFAGNGTLIIGMNRGGSSVSAVDAKEHRSLLSLQQGPDAEAYAALSKRCFEVLGSWNLWGRNLLQLLERSGVALNSVAYIHAVPFRVSDNAELNSIYKDVWQRFTIRQFEALNPARVLFAGKQVGQTLQKLVPVKSYVVPRTGRDIAYPNHSGVPHARRVAQAHDSIASDSKFWSKNV